MFIFHSRSGECGWCGRRWVEPRLLPCLHSVCTPCLNTLLTPAQEAPGGDENESSCVVRRASSYSNIVNPISSNRVLKNSTDQPSSPSSPPVEIRNDPPLPEGCSDPPQPVIGKNKNQKNIWHVCLLVNIFFYLSINLF